jgi:hydroxymethylpyrimidine/phosphomethylpyrimidine kinase
MSNNRPFVLSIAGFDPSGGAGVLADVKTFEQHQVYGLAIITGNTIQTESDFIKTEWISIDFVLESIAVLFNKYEIKAVKIGIVPTLEYLEQIVFQIKKLSQKTKIIWDTVLKSSTDFNFMDIENQIKLVSILNQIDLITPNYNEIIQLGSSNKSTKKIAETLSQHCAILLKGGHNLEALGTDYLFLKNEILTFLPETKNIFSKHGSGCVLSSAITANLALGNDLTQSCSKAKKYIEDYLNSNTSLLGYHHDS